MTLSNPLCNGHCRRTECYPGADIALSSASTVFPDANVLSANAQLGDGNDERDVQTNSADDPCKAVGESDLHAMAEENGPQAHGEMAHNEQGGEGIMGDDEPTDQAIDRWGLPKPTRKSCQCPGISVRE